MARKNIYDNDQYAARKKQRTERYLKNHGRKLVVCTACNGSGRYDNTGSPACGCCGGTGKMKQS